VKADTVEVLGLFQTDVRYLVPIYQRNYKWDELEQWAPLWSDLVDVAEDVLELGETGDVGDHFLGAIVCDQVPAFGRDAKAISVIDGQQRLTTLALILASIRFVCLHRGFEEDAEYLWSSVHNKDAVVKDRLEHRFKVWPNPADRQGFVAAMEGRTGVTRPQRAVEFFTNAIDEWLDDGSNPDSADELSATPNERMSALISATLRFVKLVKIDLEENDNAQIIFETLNGRGERLTDADLIRNALFRQADQDGVDSESLYNAYWSPFDNEKWARSVAHGRHQRDRLSLFLNHWLSMKELKEIPAGSIFRDFKERLRTSGASAETIAKDIAEYSLVFDSFESHPALSREWWFFRRLDEMNLITVYPVLLFLYGVPLEVVGIERRLRALEAIESFLVRRLISRSSTRGYGNLFAEVLQVAGIGDPVRADERIIELLAEKTADTDKWPRDADVRSAVLNTNIYKLKQSRLKMVLEAIDVHCSQGGNVETVTLGHALWVEHLLPQGWREVPEWKLPEGVGDPTKAALDRDHKLHTLGNLTLTTSKLDITMSNRPWAEKVVMLNHHTSLQLNRDLVTEAPEIWDEDEIAARGCLLADYIITIWPSPETLLQVSETSG
jgi:hypothetical protein